MSKNIKYIEIVDNIKQKIFNNIYKPNEILPSEKELCVEYNVSRRTVRRSILRLVEEGFLYTVPGKGTFVRVLNNDNYEVDFELSEIIYRGFDKSELYEVTILSPDVYLVYNLQVAPTDKVFRIQSLLKRGDEIVAFDIKNIPYFLGIPVNESDLTYSSLRDILKNKMSEYEMCEEIIISSIIPDSDIIKIMNLKKDEPLMILDIIISDSDKNPLGWNRIYIKCDECEIKGVSI